MADKRLKMGEGLAQFILNFTMDGQQCKNVMYFEHHAFDMGTDNGLSAWNDVDAQQQADNLGSAWGDNYAAFAGSDVTLNSVSWCWNELVDVGPLHEGNAFAGHYGVNAGVTLPNNVTLSIKLNTGLGGRGNHGRFYFVGINDGLCDVGAPNILKPSSAADITAASAAFLTEANADHTVLGTGFKVFMAVASFIYHGLVRAVAVSHPVTVLSLVDTVLDSQRKRLPGRGR